MSAEMLATRSSGGQCDHVGAGFGQAERHGAPDAGGAADDHRDASGQIKQLCRHCKVIVAFAGAQRRAGPRLWLD